MSSVGRLPASALPMAGGLLVVGIGGFGFLAVVGHTTPASSAAALSALYLIGNVCGPGLFAGLEHEASRVVSSGLAAGVDVRPGLRRVVAAGIGLTGAALLVLVALAPVLVPRSFAGHTGLLLWLLLGVAGSAQAFLVRGILGGARKFGAYGVTLAVEGAARLLPCLAFAVLGVANVNVYGLAFAGAMGFAAAAAYPWLRRGALSLAPVRVAGTVDPEAERPASSPGGRAPVAPVDPRAAGVGPAGPVVLDGDRAAVAGAVGSPVGVEPWADERLQPIVGASAAESVAAATSTVEALGAVGLDHDRVGGAGAAGSPVAVEVREAVEAGQALRPIARGVGLLGTATLLAQLVANLAPLVVTGRMLGSAAGEAAAAAFAFAFVLTRAPLLLFSPVQALLLPRVAAAVVRGELDVVRRQVRTGLVAVAAVGIGGAALAALAGPWAVQTLFGAEQRPSVLVTGLLGVSTGLLLVVQLLQPVLVALGRHRTVSVAWIVGTAVLAGLLVLPGPAVTAAVIAQLTAAAVVALVATSGVVDVLRAAPVAGDRAAEPSSLMSTECVRPATKRALEPR